MNKRSILVPYTLSMPGTIIDTGTGIINDGLIFYPLTGERLVPHDYVITATSRATNVWAFVATILVILIAIGSFMYKLKGFQWKIYHRFFIPWGGTNCSIGWNKLKVAYFCITEITLSFLNSYANARAH